MISSESAIIDSGTSLMILYDIDFEKLLILFNVYGDCEYVSTMGMIFCYSMN